MFEGSCLNGRFGKTDHETVYRNCQALCTMGRKTWRHGVPHEQNCAVCGYNLAKINMIYHFYAPGQLEYSSIDKMAKYNWSTFRNYVAFLAGELAPGTRHPHHDSESSSCYHEAFLLWGHYHNNIVLFHHDSPITRSHFVDPTDRAIKGFYCIYVTKLSHHRFWKWHLFSAKPFLYPPLQRIWKGDILVSPCPSVHLSVCGQNHVRSVSSTILVGPISYLHILSSNFRRCVACNACWNFGEFFKFVALTLSSSDLRSNMTQ